MTVDTVTVHTVKNLASSAFLVAGAGRAMIVDTGVAGRAPAMLRKISEVGLRPADVSLIVLTTTTPTTAGRRGSCAKSPGHRSPSTATTPTSSAAADGSTCGPPAWCPD